MTARLRRLAAVALAVLIVSSSVASPVVGASTSPTGTAAIDSPDGFSVVAGGSCSYSGLFNFFGINLNDNCGPGAPDTSGASNEVEVYQRASETKSWAETTTAQTNNSLTNLQTTLYASGEARQNAVIENGTTSVPSVNTAVNQSIDQRLSKMQMNQIAAWNQFIQSLINAQNGTSQDVIAVYADGISWSNGPSQDGRTKLSSSLVSNQTLVLANGTEVPVLQLKEVRVSGGSTVHITIRLNEYLSIYGTGTPVDDYGLEAKSVNSNPRIKFALESWQSNWQTLQQKAQIAKENLAATASWKVDAYAAGELDLANATSGLTLAQEYSTSYAETGNLAYARAAAAASGYATPDLDNVSVMNVTEDGFTYTGALFSQSAPDNGTWKLGQTYNASRIDGVQLVATTSGKTHTLTGNFTVTAMKDANGQTLNQTHVRQYDYQTANTSEYRQLQQELNELREEVANQTAGGSGSGSGSGSGGSGPLIIVGLAVVAIGAAAVMQRDN
ncbi:hypothetical protein [Halarchaeum nitratireducens]|uniref:Envelope protein N-terminal domain-containing protein n=1 Tax=Halarchaeum nitratireducens TaxID=489913 RepID=A0A830GAZ8_9EURY|nr:hypothetical protein [Halarchaeum nitratireducens]GGN17888.1 hypothetical protein GCM10009021_18480 [Halarchaeum nitratireducens]